MYSIAAGTTIKGKSPVADLNLLNHKLLSAIRVLFNRSEFSEYGITFILLYPSSAPPLTGRMQPVINLALSDNKNTQASATTSPAGQYPRGCIASRYAAILFPSGCCFDHLASIPVHTPAGLTALTRILYRA